MLLTLAEGGGQYGDDCDADQECQKSENDHGYQHHSGGPASGRGVNLTYADHAQDHTVDGYGDDHQNSQYGDSRQPAGELKYRGVCHDPERAFIPCVRRPDDKQDEQVVDRRPDKQTDGRAYGGDNKRTEQAAESTAKAVARSQGDQQPDYPGEQATDDGADNREDEGVKEIALPADTTEEAYRVEDDLARRLNEARHELGVIEVRAGGTTRYPWPGSALTPSGATRSRPSARSRVEIHVNLLSHRTSD